jgi:hypothetical protein
MFHVAFRTRVHVMSIGSTLMLSGCTDQTAPTAAPTGAHAESDPLRMGPLIIVCELEDTRCVPTYAVACPSQAEQAGAAAIWWLPISARERAWCAGRNPPGGNDLDRGRLD